jgi:hypothetical protein
MASSFQRYSQGIQPVSGMAEAGANIGKMYQQGIASFGDSLAKGLQQYNENSAKNDILTAEAEQLGQQIQMFQKQFGDSPEHKDFADSLQPYIEQLAKVPSMSLTQKMGAVTGVKAGFANIGQQLQVFELMRGERIKRDMNTARGGVREFDEVTVPTAIIPAGKLPYFYDKSYADNEAEVVRLANEAKDRGANVDIAKTLSEWRKDFKASAMSRTDMPPAVKEALIKQIEAGENLTDNIQTDESGVTDYAKEAEMYDRTSTSVKEQLAPPKVEAPANVGTAPLDARQQEAESVKRKAQDELSKIDELIKKANDVKEKGDSIPQGWMDSTSRLLEGGILDSINISALKSLARLNISQGRFKEITPDIARQLRDEVLRSGGAGTMAMLGSLIIPDPSAFGLGLINPTRKLTKAEEQFIEGAFTDWRSTDRIKKAKESGDADVLEEELLKRKELLQNQLATGKSAPRPSDIAKVQQAQAPQAKAKEEQPYVLTNPRAIVLGTTTTQVASSVESKRKDMKNFFQKKYGYVPSSFEESFKAIYPEANFKTMETPYGVFMHDGKEWKQIQVQQPKVMSNKELAEEKSVTFGQPNTQGGLDYQELIPKSGIYIRGIFAGTPTEAFKFRTEMLETANAKVAVNRLIEINDMVGESMPWNAKLWGEAKALLPQIKAGLRTDIIGVGTVSNYEQQLIEEVVADPTKFWSLESSDRAKLAEIMRRVNNRLADKPALYGLDVKIAGQSNAEIEKNLRLGRAGKSKLELDFEARGGKKGVNLNWNLSNKIPDALK